MDLEKRALVAMNDSAFQGMMTEMLPFQGYQTVDIGTDLDDVLRKVREHQYSAIIMDVNFPVANGPIDPAKKVHALVKDRIGTERYNIIFIGFTGNTETAALARREGIPTIAKPELPLKYLDVAEYSKLLQAVGRK